jgi:dGTP triphosphohydrolase
MNESSDFLEERAAELEARARNQRDDTDELIADLPDNAWARVAKLATLLGLDALDALRREVTLDQLAEESRARDDARKQAESQVDELGLGLPKFPGGG